ncbi:MAG: beta-lactamase family protein [Gammaproteobacteria bacterium]|nr:beta-lactamase family protein [Gammaproteobacteria bacterium]
MTRINADRLSQLSSVIERDIQSGKYFGASAIVSCGNRIEFSESFGYVDKIQTKPISTETVFPLMSVSKSLTAVLVLSMVERGDIQLTTRVSEIVPEFGANGKLAVTVAQLLSHTSGLGDETPPGHDSVDPQSVLAHICNAPLRSPLGHFAYSGEAGYFVLGEIVRKLDAKHRSFENTCQEDLFEPLGMDSTAFSTTTALQPRRVPISIAGDLNGFFTASQLLSLEEALSSGLVEPGGSCISSTQDLHRFAQMLLQRGELDGTRILSPAMVKLATQIHTGSDQFGVFQFGRQIVGAPELRANYGLGFQMRGPIPFQAVPHGTLASPSTFGHRGAGLTCFWVDPATEVIFVCLTSGFLEETESAARWQQLSDIVHSAIS